MGFTIIITIRCCSEKLEAIRIFRWNCIERKIYIWLSWHRIIRIPESLEFPMRLHVSRISINKWSILSYKFISIFCWYAAFRMFQKTSHKNYKNDKHSLESRNQNPSAIRKQTILYFTLILEPIQTNVKIVAERKSCGYSSSCLQIRLHLYVHEFILKHARL